MPVAALSQNSFNAGELSELLLGRQDLDKYNSGLRICLNWLGLVQGPLTRRPGTHFVRTTKFGGDRKARLLSFEFNVAQTYVLEFGHQYIRFFTGQAPLTFTPISLDPYDTATAATVSGGTWKDVTKGHDGADNSRWVAVAQAGITAYSDDEGATWTVNSALTSDSLAGVYHNGKAGSEGLFIAVGLKNANSGIWKSSNGISWTEVTTPIPTANNINDVVYSPDLDLWVAVGGDVAPSDVQFILTSPDGDTWTDRAPGTKELTAVTWGSFDGQFIAVGQDEEIAVSTNGTTWTRSSIGGGNSLVGISTDNKGRWLTVAGTNSWVSDNKGTSWTSKGLPLGAGHVWQDCHHDGQTFPNGTGTFFICGRENSVEYKVAVSVNGGDSWTALDSAHPVAPTIGYEGIFVDPNTGNWVAVAEADRIAFNALVVTNASPPVLTVPSHGYNDGDYITITGVQGMAGLNNLTVKVANSTVDTFEITDIYDNPIDTSLWPAYTVGGEVAKLVEVATPYTESELDEIRVVQSADVLYIFHPDHEPATLVRDSATSWTYSEIDLLDGPYDLINSTSTTLTPSAATGSITVTASSTVGINGGAGFLTTDIGRRIRIQDNNGTWTWVEITAHTDSLNVTALVRGPDFAPPAATVNWRLGLWSDTTGFPTTGLFFEDRLWMGGADLFPNRLDGSRTGLYSNFTPSDFDGTVVDDHAVNFTLSSSDVNQIYWMVDDEKGLLVGTAGGEWPIRPSTLGEAITPTNISGKKSTKYGSAPVHPVKPGKAVLFIQRARQKLRELAYVFESDGFSAPDMTLLSEHISNPSMNEIAYQQQPQSLVWIQRTDGVLLGFTYERDQNVLGWHQHVIGGFSDAVNSPAEVESVASNPHPDGDRDELYIIVKRFINGRQERFIERLGDIWKQGDALETALYLDSGFTNVNSLAPSNIVGGLYNHEGETLKVLADGRLHQDITVQFGQATLDFAATNVSVGYGYNSDASLLPLEGGSANGTAQGKQKRVTKLGIWLRDTLGLKYGRSFDKLDRITDTKWGDAFNTKLTPFTGVKRLPFDGASEIDPGIVFRADTAYPATILSVMPVVATEDDS